MRFAGLAVEVPITGEGLYVRFDGVMDDLDGHQAKLLREFNIAPSSLRYTNAAKNGRTMVVRFAGGQRCAVVWVRADENQLVTEGRLAHEQFHVVAGVAREQVARLEGALASKGFPVPLRSFDEESAATIVEVATIHLLGARLEDIHGSELIEKAHEVLLRARERRPAGAESK